MENMIKPERERVLAKKDPDLPGQPKRPFTDLKPGMRHTPGETNAEVYKPRHMNRELYSISA